MLWKNDEGNNMVLEKRAQEALFKIRWSKEAPQEGTFKLGCEK